MVSLVLTQATFWLCGAAFVSLFIYRRGEAQFKRGVSILAVLVMGCCGTAMLHIVKGDLLLPTGAWPLVVLLAVFAWSLIRSGGNLAGVLRPEGWNGLDRRRRNGAQGVRRP
ncbi:phage holin family protein [Pseudomonas sp. LRF_L74]|uniref:phage holin family protein n=1 Tax=Pseudomonas sp. LRF_L74 TaxID=3369422 RepID=UPI003F643E74